MAEKLASAYVEIHPWLANSFSKELSSSIDGTGIGDKAGKAAGKAFGAGFQSQLSSISSSSGKAGKALTKGITVPAVAAATAVGSIFAVKGWERLTAIDTAESKLKGLGYTGSEISSVMDSALASVKGTAYGLGDAANVAVGALAAGVNQGEDLTRVLKTVADTATIAGGDFQGTAAIFNKVMAKGKAQGDEILQLSEKGVPVLQTIGKYLGKTAEEVSDLASQGEISFDTFEASMREAFGGAALASGESMIGMADNVWAAVGRVGAAFLDSGSDGEGFFTKLKPLLGELTGDLDGMTEVAGEWGSAFADVFTDVVDIVRSGAEAFGELSPAQKETVLQLGLMAVSAGPALTVFSKLTSGTSKVVGALGKGKTALDKVAGGFDNMAICAALGKGNMTGVGAAIGGVASKSKAASSVVTKLGTALAKPGPLLAVAALATVAGVAATAFMQAAEKERTFVDATDGLRDAVAGANDGLKTGTAVGVSYRSGLISATDSVSKLISKQAQLAQSIRESNTEVNADVAQLDIYQQAIADLTSRYDENGNAAQLSAADQSRLKLAVEGVNEICGTSYSVVDALNGVIADEGGAVDGTAEAIKRYIDQKKIQLQLDAMEGQYSELLTAKTDAQNALTDALVEQQRIQSLLNENYAKGDAWVNENRDAVAQLERDLDTCNDTVDDARAAYDAAADAAGSMERSMELMQSAVDGNASAWETLLAKSPNIAGVFSRLGADVGDLASDLEATGVAQEEFASLGDEQIAALASAYDGSIGSIIGRLGEMGLSVDETMLGISTDSDLMSDTVQQAFRDANISQDDFIRKVAESGISVEEFQSLSSVQLQLLASRYGEMGGDVSSLIEGFIADNQSGAEATAALESKGSANMSGLESASDKAFSAMSGDIRGYNATKLENKNASAKINHNLNESIQAVKNWNSAWNSISAGTKTATLIKKTINQTVTQNAAGGFRLHADGGYRLHASGAIATKATPLDIVGEDGAEAIVPLTNKRYAQPFVRMIAEEVAKITQQPASTENYYLDGRVFCPDAQMQKAFSLIGKQIKRRSRMRG